MDTLVSVAWVAEHLRDPNLVIMDCRFVLGDVEKGREAYEAGHIPGAIYFDLEKDLSAPKTVHGGRHPWPKAEVLAEKLGQAGIPNDATIIVYDEQKGAMAARAYWVLRYVGHKNVALLDGGFSAWKAAGQPVTADAVSRPPVVYEPHVQDEWLCDVEGVRHNVKTKEALLIDSRAFTRYTGEAETVDPIGGHIPGAVNYDWQHVMDEQGTLKSKEELEAHFANLPHDRDVIVYCGSGVTACANLFALERLGYQNVKLYPGSWSDWISYPEHEKVTGKE